MFATIPRVAAPLRAIGPNRFQFTASISICDRAEVCIQVTNAVFYSLDSGSGPTNTSGSGQPTLNPATDRKIFTSGGAPPQTFPINETDVDKILNGHLWAVAQGSTSLGGRLTTSCDYAASGIALQQGGNSSGVVVCDINPVRNTLTVSLVQTATSSGQAPELTCTLLVPIAATSTLPQPNGTASAQLGGTARSSHQVLRFL